MVNYRSVGREGLCSLDQHCASNQLGIKSNINFLFLYRRKKSSPSIIFFLIKTLIGRKNSEMDISWITWGDSPQLSTIFPSIITLFKVLCRLDGEPDSKVSPQLSIGAQQVPSVAEQLPACEHRTDFPRLRLSYLSCRVFRICNIQILKRKKIVGTIAMHTAQPAHERDKFLDKYINQNVYKHLRILSPYINHFWLGWLSLSMASWNIKILKLN